MDTNKITVFLSATGTDEHILRNDMCLMLQKAGIEVVFPTDFTDNDFSFTEDVKRNISQATCSLHILGNSFGQTINGDASMSLTKFQYLEAKKKLKLNPEFKMFLWYPQQLIDGTKEILQESFINEIRYGIEWNVVFATTSSPIQLVDDIRNMMETKEQMHFDIKDT